jgi:dTMP kinase
MYSGNRDGLFVSIDGPSGVGKTTTCRGLVAQLRDTWESVHSTREPTTTALGGFVRAHADTYHGMALACLVAGDRHHHVATEILPALRSGALVVTDRYLPSSLVLQVRDGVPAELVWHINQGVPRPDSAVILTGHIKVLSRRLTRRGTQDRFETALDMGEIQRFAEVAEELSAAGWPVYVLDCGGLSPEEVVAAERGFNVGVLDAEAAGLGVDFVIGVVNAAKPRWVGFNLLAPTYEISARIAAGLDPDIHLMLGGHQAKAMPVEILTDLRMERCAGLIVGEGETRVAELLDDHHRRSSLPGVMWLDPVTKTPVTGGQPGGSHHLAPNIDALPFVDRRFLIQDPHLAGGIWEAKMVGARGCPYDCSFCGAAVSANPDVTIRVRDPRNIIEEMHRLRTAGVRAFRFVDDLFLGARRVIEKMSEAFTAEGVGEWARWDATGRINVLHRAKDDTLEQLATNGLREVALGIESGSVRVLDYIDKRITPEMAVEVVRRLCERGIGVKGYFILGFPGETREEIEATERLVHRLWEVTDRLPGLFRVSVFEFRPYPGTPEWHRLMQTGRHTPAELSNYSAVDLTGGGVDEAMLARDEFNFSTNVQFSDVPIDVVRAKLVALAHAQYDRLRC